MPRTVRPHLLTRHPIRMDSQSQRGHGIAHIAAAFGSLSILRLLYIKNAEIFDMKNAMKKTPLQVAQDIGEEDAALLIVALLEVKDDGTIGLGKGLDMDDDDGVEVEPTPSDTPRASSAKGSDVEEAAAVPPASPIEVS